MIILTLNQLSICNLEDFRVYLHYSRVTQIEFEFAEDIPDFVQTIYNSIFNVPFGQQDAVTETRITFILRFWSYLKSLSCKNADDIVMLEKGEDAVRLMDKKLFNEYHNLDSWVGSTYNYEDNHLKIDTRKVSRQGLFAMLNILYLWKKGTYCKITLQRGSRHWLDTEIDWFESVLTSYLGKRKASTYLCPLHPVVIEMLSCFLDCIFDLKIGSDDKLLYTHHDFENGYLLRT